MSDVSGVTEVEVLPAYLTLKDLHARLQERGVKMSYSWLSHFMQTGDIMEQLQVKGAGNTRQFPPQTVDILEGFYQVFRDLGGKVPHAPAMLKRFLEAQGLTTGEHGSRELTVIPSATETVFVPNTKAMPPAVSPESRLAEAAAIGREQGLAQADEILKAHQVAAILGIAARSVRKSVPASFRLGKGPVMDRWYKSDLMRLGGNKTP